MSGGDKFANFKKDFPGSSSTPTSSNNPKALHSVPTPVAAGAPEDGAGMSWGGSKGGTKNWVPPAPGDKPGSDPTPWMYLAKPEVWTISVINLPCSDEPDRKAQLLIDGKDVLTCRCKKNEYGTITEEVEAPIVGDRGEFELKIPRMFVVDQRAFAWNNGKFIKYAMRNDGLAIAQQSEPFGMIDATALPFRNIDITTIKR